MDPAADEDTKLDVTPEPEDTLLGEGDLPEPESDLPAPAGQQGETPEAPPSEAAVPTEAPPQEVPQTVEDKPEDVPAVSEGDEAPPEAPPAEEDAPAAEEPEPPAEEVPTAPDAEPTGEAPAIPEDKPDPEPVDLPPEEKASEAEQVSELLREAATLLPAVKGGDIRLHAAAQELEMFLQGFLGKWRGAIDGSLAGA